MRIQPVLPPRVKQDVSLMEKFPNPTLNKDAFYEIKMFESDKAAIAKSDFKRISKPSFFSDPRIKHGWCSTLNGEQVLNLPSSTAASTSFHAGSCTSCDRLYNHSINGEPMLFIIADENCPPALGSKGECCAVLRVDDGDFHQARAVLTHQMKKGLRINPKSVIVCLLLSHLMRYGVYTYINDFLEFAGWARRLLKVTVIPGIPPFPLQQLTIHLIPVSQYFTFLQGSQVGCGRADSDSLYSLWSPFMTTSFNLKTGQADIPANPIFLKKAEAYLKCSTAFPPGFDGDWSSGTPKEVQIEFFSNLLNHLRMHDLCSDIHLPSIEAIKAGIIDNLKVEQKIFMIGTSIARDIEKALQPLCAAKGIKTFAETRGGHFINKWDQIDLSSLQAATSHDKLFVYWLGNEMFDMESCDIDDRTLVNVPVYHPKAAKVLDDTAMDRLVAISGKKLRHLAKIFPGHIYFHGPAPRFLAQCCDDPLHIIKGPSDEIINIADYTTAFASFIERSPGVVQERISFVHYQEIFGNTFDSRMLSDGVHLNQSACNTFAKFILDRVDEEPVVTIPELLDSDFSDYLRLNKVIDVKLQGSDGVDDDDVDMNIDTAIKLSALTN